MYRITTDGLTNGVAPFELNTDDNPFLATFSEFVRMTTSRGFDIPIDLVCKNGEKEIILEYSYLEANEFTEKVRLTFKVEFIK